MNNQSKYLNEIVIIYYIILNMNPQYVPTIAVKQPSSLRSFSTEPAQSTLRMDVLNK
jgi:hypothetical protein